MRVKRFVRFLAARYRPDLSRMFAQRPSGLRKELPAVLGIGRRRPTPPGSTPEGSSSVVDAYTRRILERHPLAAARGFLAHSRQDTKAGN